MHFLGTPIGRGSAAPVLCFVPDARHIRRGMVLDSTQGTVRAAESKNADRSPAEDDFPEMDLRGIAWGVHLYGAPY